MDHLLSLLQSNDPLSGVVHDLAKLAEQISLISDRLGNERLTDLHYDRLFTRFLEWIAVFQDGIRFVLSSITNESDLKSVVDLEIRLAELLGTLERCRRSGQGEVSKTLLARDIQHHFREWQSALIPIGF